MFYFESIQYDLLPKVNELGVIDLLNSSQIFYRHQLGFYSWCNYSEARAFVTS